VTIIDLNPNGTRQNPEMPEGVRLYAAALDELDTWDDELTALNLALVDAAFARDRLAEATRQMDLEEARIILGAVGGNAETRKAAVTLALAEACPVYADLLGQQREQRLKLADAERRAELSRQRCRLLREAVRLAQPEA